MTEKQLQQREADLEKAGYHKSRNPNARSMMLISDNYYRHNTDLVTMPFSESNASRCVVPADEWDGDTGIAELLRVYREDNLLMLGDLATRHPKPKTKPEPKPKQKPKTAPEPKPAPKPEPAPRMRRGKEGDTDTHKRCRRCGEVKPRTEFYKCKNARDGLESYCRVCKSEVRLIYYDRKTSRSHTHAEEPQATKTHKVCTICKAQKPIEEFYRNGNTCDGREIYCKDCSRERRKANRRRRLAEGRLPTYRIAPGDTETHKRCRRCGEVKPRTEYNRNIEASDRLNYYCKACVKLFKQQKKQRENDQS